MALPRNRTKIVCTIGPASGSLEVLVQMIRAGMNVARLNFSHGDFADKEQMISNIRKAAGATGRRVAILGDLSGPKMRIGQLAEEPVELKVGEAFTLTTEEITGDGQKASVSFKGLAKAVRPGDTLFLNDGFIQLEAEQVEGPAVRCRVRVGGELRSRKGLNLPGIDLGICAFTDRDRECLAFAARQKLDAVSQSFVESAADVRAVREAAKALDYHPFLIAKIERSRALGQIEGILEAADGIMVARGDLGVEIPIEEIAVIQKELTRRANFMAKPVITATQMLESMTVNRRPTRAESTDVANAVLDGTDCVMLSEESAMGDYPVDAVDMLAKIAAATEPHRHRITLEETSAEYRRALHPRPIDLISLNVQTTVDSASPAAVIAPSGTGVFARSLARLKLPVWIAAVTTREATCQQVQFSYGVHAVHVAQEPENWNLFAKRWVDEHHLPGKLAVLAAGPSPKHPGRNNRMEIIDLEKS